MPLIPTIPEKSSVNPKEYIRNINNIGHKSWGTQIPPQNRFRASRRLHRRFNKRLGDFGIRQSHFDKFYKWFQPFLFCISLQKSIRMQALFIFLSFVHDVAVWLRLVGREPSYWTSGMEVDGKSEGWRLLYLYPYWHQAFRRSIAIFPIVPCTKCDFRWT